MTEQLFDISWLTIYTDWTMINPHYFFFRGALWCFICILSADYFWIPFIKFFFEMGKRAMGANR